ncbi:MAG: glycosyltransferase [Acidimicrobiaceae bacterium]|jgi:D-inositol-3-phosphate glycosyltransferase|nr:glycosyltransferase [Ilumatobacteraceae bacterium]
MRRVAILSLHTSPLAQPGVGDGGGMNVYVRELVSGLAHAGIDCTTYTRAWRDDLPAEILVEPNHRVVHIPAGDPHMPKDNLVDVVPQFTDNVLQHIQANGGTDVVHANYWLSGLSGHSLKHELNVPLVSTFHTFARVKALGGDPESELRERAETEVIGCSDAICVSCTEEERQFIELYGTPPGQIEIVAPGVEHAFFAPGDKRGARKALDLGDGPVLLFVGRIQPLKGADVAVRALAALGRKNATLLIVGGASGTEGEREIAHVHSLIQEFKLESQVRFVEPQAHHILSTYYRAADVVLVPSRSESFGLVALEAAACGTPVVANAVGGLLTIVEHGRTGFLVADRQPEVFARHIANILDDPALSERMSVLAAERARGYTWSFAAARLRRAYADLTSRDRVVCK